ncbi:hypothetical protein [Mycobacteroides salmoniphilum]|uniref:hypothetical protein n=1 Tax=Mycobacteroides salmoniphilum TaxID=404941 RepID=UPI001066557D|nr:hypothetical protein [Mycobacteroides salmoniphilum]
MTTSERRSAGGPFSGDRYGQATTAGLQELVEAPTQIVIDWSAPLLRELDSAGRIKWLRTDSGSVMPGEQAAGN